MAKASDVVLSDEAATAGPVRDCLGQRVPVEPAIVTAVLAGGGAADRAVVSVVRACERAAGIAGSVGGGDEAKAGCLLDALAATPEQDLQEFQSRLLNGSLGDPGETGVGKDLASCQ